MQEPITPRTNNWIIYTAIVSHKQSVHSKCVYVVYDVYRYNILRVSIECFH